MVRLPRSFPWSPRPDREAQCSYCMLPPGPDLGTCQGPQSGCACMQSQGEPRGGWQQATALSRGRGHWGMGLTCPGLWLLSLMNVSSRRSASPCHFGDPALGSVYAGAQCGQPSSKKRHSHLADSGWAKMMACGTGGGGRGGGTPFAAAGTAAMALRGAVPVVGVGRRSRRAGWQGSVS